MNLKQLRINKKLTQADMGKLLNITAPTYNGYETEKYEPNIETLCKLADYYDVSLDYLVGRERKGDVGYLTPAQLTAVKVIQRLNQQNLLLLTGRAMAMLEAQGE